MPDPFYNTQAWQKLRRSVSAAWRQSAKPCHYCGQPLEWHPGQVIVDHVIPRRHAPELELDRRNLVCVHHGCNTRKHRHVEAPTRTPIGPDGFPPGWQ